MFELRIVAETPEALLEQLAKTHALYAPKAPVEAALPPPMPVSAPLSPEVPPPALQMVLPAAPAVMSMPPAYASAPAQPLPGVAPGYTLDQIMIAAGRFAELGEGQRQAALALLPKYGASGLYDLREDQHNAFVMDLRALGAQI